MIVDEQQIELAAVGELIAGCGCVTFEIRGLVGGTDRSWRSWLLAFNLGLRVQAISQRTTVQLMGPACR